jgi:hypothetical protein
MLHCHENFTGVGILLEHGRAGAPQCLPWARVLCPGQALDTHLQALQNMSSALGLVCLLYASTDSCLRCCFSCISSSGLTPCSSPV